MTKLECVYFFYYIIFQTGFNAVFGLVFGFLCRHTASNPITAEMHTSGVQ